MAKLTANPLSPWYESVKPGDLVRARALGAYGSFRGESRGGYSVGSGTVMLVTAIYHHPGYPTRRDLDGVACVPTTGPGSGGPAALFYPSDLEMVES